MSEFTKDGKTVYQMSDDELRSLTEEELKELSPDEYQHRYNCLFVSDEMAETLARFNDPDQHSYRYG